MGTHLMFVFTKPATEQFYNNGRVGAFASKPQSFTKGAVGLSSVQVWGQRVEYHEGIVNHEMALYDDPLRRREIDSLLIANGMISGLDEIDVHLDPKTAKTLHDLTLSQHKAYLNQDFELLARLNKDIRDLRNGF